MRTVGREKGALMKLSAKSRYALEAMLYLAAGSPVRPASIRQVSEGTGISDSYLEQIFFRLRKAGLLAAVRGAGGGFYPARELSKITAGEIVRAMEDGATPVLCVDDPSLCKSRLTACCRTRSLWVRISEEIYRKLDAESLSGLRDRYLASLAAGKGGAE